MIWKEVIEELEGATEQLRAVARDDFAAVAAAMNRRSRAILRLQKCARSSRGPVPPPIVERIRKDRARGADTREKLLLMRAGACSEVSRLAESAYLMRALARNPERTRRRVNCTL